MLPKSVKMLTIPLFPYPKHGIGAPLKKRIRPSDSLDIRKMLCEINKSSLITFDICGKAWSVVSVYSSYSPDIHLMMVEVSPDRYLPGPEKVPDEEGDKLTQVWAAIMELIASRKSNRTIHTGYNWSPRSWGKEEEKTGFQSIPTKWHPQLWGWPDFSDARKKSKYIKVVDTDSLSISEKRLLGQNDYIVPFAGIIKEKFKKTFTSRSRFYKIFACENWQIDERGLYLNFDYSIPQILRTAKFFSRFLKPISIIMDETACELTEILTAIKCRQIDAILKRTEKGVPEHPEKLRAGMRMHSETYIREAFKKRHYPDSLLEAILEPVRNRCLERGKAVNWWRKCFAYSFVMSGPAKGKTGQMRIMPAVYNGPGGVVEALGVVLRRPEDRQFGEAEIIKKNEALQKLAKDLKKLGFDEIEKKILKNFLKYV